MNVQTPNARNSDPVTSHLAGQEITNNGTRSRQIDLVVGLVREAPGKTSAELAEDSGNDRYMVARRLADACGVKVMKGKHRKCRVSGRQAVTWWYVDMEDDQS